MSRPIWQRKTIISTKRNISVVVWPGFIHEDQSQGPPNISVQEGKNEGESQTPNWVNTTIPITLDKLPQIILNLQLAYLKAIEFESGEPAMTPVTPPQEMSLSAKIFKAVCDERSIAVDEIVERLGMPIKEVNEAIKILESKEHVKLVTKELRIFVEVP